MRVREAIGKFWAILGRRNRLHTVSLLGFMVVAAFMEMVGLSTIPAFLGLLAESQEPTGNPLITTAKSWLGVESHREFLMVTAAVLAVVFAIQTVFLGALAYFKARFVARIVQHTSHLLFSGYLRAPLAFHAERHTSTAANQIVLESMRTANGFTYPLMHMIQSACLIVAIATFVVVMSPMIANIALVGIALLAFVFMVVMRRRASAYGRTLTRKNAKLTEDVTEALGCVKHIRLRGLEGRFERAFDRDSVARADAIGFQKFANEFPKPVLEGTTVIGMIIVVFGMMSLQPSLSGVIPTFGLIGAAIARLLPHINQFTSWILRIYQHASSAEALADDILELQRLGIYETSSDSEADTTSRLLHEAIRFEHVCFRYPQARDDSIHDVTLTIPAKSAVAFVGPTGAGKSTIVDLICGLVGPTDGRIWIDDQDQRAARQLLQRRVGYIPQAIFIANRNVRENVAIGLDPDEIDDARVWEVLRQAQIDAFVAELPDGLDTQCGESGVRLSGGQRQRIGIARALYHDPEILVLDEATAALDNETERRLMSAIDQVRANRTLIMIAHRLSSIRDCDRIFVMENGQVTGEGTYDDLLQSHQGFRAMAA